MTFSTESWIKYNYKPALDANSWLAIISQVDMTTFLCSNDCATVWCQNKTKINIENWEKKILFI